LPEPPIRYFKKEVEENLNLAYASVGIGNENKEVLECQFVTTTWSQENPKIILSGSEGEIRETILRSMKENCLFCILNLLFCLLYQNSKLI